MSGLIIKNCILLLNKFDCFNQVSALSDYIVTVSIVHYFFFRKDHTLKRKSRSQSVEEFFSWLNQNEVDTSNVKVSEFKEGLGLEAIASVKVHACLCNYQDVPSIV